MKNDVLKHLDFTLKLPYIFVMSSLHIINLFLTVSFEMLNVNESAFQLTNMLIFLFKLSFLGQPCWVQVL